MKRYLGQPIGPPTVECSEQNAGRENALGDIESQTSAVDANGVTPIQPRTNNSRDDSKKTISLFKESTDEDFSTESETSSSNASEMISRSTMSPNQERCLTEADRNHRRESLNKEEKHFGFFGHGTLLTVLGLVFAWTGFACSYEARNTTNFARVEKPIHVDIAFDNVFNVGLVYVQLCFNQTETDTSSCIVENLETDDINDRMFQVSRSMAFLAYLFGGFLAACMTSSIFWQSINIRVVGGGFLLTYFLQSFTFLFFDSELCSTYNCHLSRGTVYSIVSSLCWILSCLAGARMDAYKYKQVMLARRKGKMSKKRKSSDRNKPLKLDRLVSDVTQDATWNTESNTENARIKIDSSASKGMNGTEDSLSLPQILHCPTHANIEASADIDVILEDLSRLQADKNILEQSRSMKKHRHPCSARQKKSPASAPNDSKKVEEEQPSIIDKRKFDL